jgi:hypothetical protein
MLPDDWRHVSLSAQEIVKEMLKLDPTGVACRNRSCRILRDSTCWNSTHDVVQEQSLQDSTYRISMWDGSVHA